MGVDVPEGLREDKGLEEGGLDVVEEGAGGLMNRGIAANVEPGVETRVALKDDVDDVVGGRVEDCWELCVAFWEGTRGWALSGGNTSFRAPEDHLTIEKVMSKFAQLLTNFVMCLQMLSKRDVNLFLPQAACCSSGVADLDSFPLSVLFTWERSCLFANLEKHRNYQI